MHSTSRASSGSCPSSASVKMLHLLLRLARLLQEPLPAQAGDVQRTAAPFGAGAQSLAFTTLAKTKRATWGPQEAFPSMGWGMPWSRDRKNRCWVSHPQRAGELLMEADVSEKAPCSGFDGASSSGYAATPEHPHGAARGAKSAGRLASVEPRGQAGSIPVPTSSNAPSKIRQSARFVGKPALSPSGPFPAPALAH